jgi:signal transduction histidine kinase
MKTTKTLVQSKTFHWAVAVIVSAIIGIVFDVQIPDAELLDIITKAVILVWGIYSIVWRIKAKDEITSIM